VIGTVYCYENLINGKRYIGATKNPHKRQRKHLWDASHSSLPFHRALKKYGIESFQYSVLETCSVDRLFEKEEFWIAKLETFGPKGYNLTTGGYHPSDISEETRRKLIFAAKKARRPTSQKTKNKIREALKGRPGKPHTDESRPTMVSMFHYQEN
jgi:group I intron endonuclease